MSATHKVPKRHVVCPASDIPPGGRQLVNVDGRSIGIFNVAGRYYALHNRCPHRGGALCEGPLCGTTVVTDDCLFRYDREGEILRCAWHGWEFEIATGRALVDPKIRARTYRVSVEQGNLVLDI